MAVQSLGSLTVDLVANTAGFERGMNQAERALQRTSKEAAYQATQLDKLIGQIDPTVAAYSRLDKMEQQLEAHRKAGRLPIEDYKQYLSQINASREAIGRTDSVLTKSGVSAKQTAAAFGQLPAQLSDIAVQLAGGQNPLLILLQQGSQIKDQFGGIGATFDAFGAKIKGLFGGASATGELADLAQNASSVGKNAEAAGEGLGSLAEGANTAADASKNAADAAAALRASTAGAGIGMGVIVTGALAAAAAIAALILAYKQGSSEASAYTKALILTGNTAGTSATELGEIAKRVSAVNGTINEASTTLAQLASSTRIPVESFQTIATAAANMEDATGKAASQTVAEFTEIAKDPVAAVLKLNESMNFLTATMYSQIKSAKDVGDSQGAAKLATEAYADAINARAPKITESLGLIEKAWKNLGDAAKTAWDTALGVGRPAAAGPDITALRQQLAYQSSLVGTEYEDDTTKERVKDLTAQIEAVDKLNKAQKEAAKSEGDRQKAQKQSLQDEQALDKLRDETETKAEKRAKELAEYQALVSRRRLASETLNDKALVISAEQQAKDIAAINEKYKDEKAPKGLAYSEDAGMKMLDNLRQQNAALQMQSDSFDDQSGKYRNLGAQAKALAEFEQQIADIKTKDVQTADQKSLLANEALLRAQLKRNVALEQEITARKQSYEEEQKLQAFQDSQSSRLNNAQDALDAQFTGLGQGAKVRERLKEDLAIRKEYQRDLDALTKQRTTGQISPELYAQETAILEESLATRLVRQQDYYNRVDEAQGDFFLGASEAWANFAAEAENFSGMAADLVGGQLSTLTEGVGTFFTSIIDGSASVGEAFANLGLTMVNSIINALAQMAAQWLVYQGLTMLGIGQKTAAVVTGAAAETAAVTASEAAKTTATLAATATTTATSLAATATTTAAQTAAAGTTLAAWLPAALVASIGSFGAAAVVGGGALLAAFALIKGFKEGGYTGGSGPNDVVGVVHGKEFVFTAEETARIGVNNLQAIASGQGYIEGGYTGTSAPVLLSPGRVSTVQSSAKLDRTLNNIQSPGNMGGNVQINMIEDASKAGQRVERVEDDQRIIDLFVSNIMNDGEAAEAMNTKYGLRTAGR